MKDTTDDRDKWWKLAGANIKLSKKGWDNSNNNNNKSGF